MQTPKKLELHFLGKMITANKQYRNQESLCNTRNKIIRSSTCQGCWSVPPNLDEDFESFRQNSRYLAFQESLEKMKNFDSLLDLYYDLGDPQQLLLDEQLRERFCEADFKVMRVAFWTVAIPPPKNEDKKVDEVQVEDALNIGSHQCLMTLKNKEICARRFKSKKALHKHQMKSQQHEQAPDPTATSFICSNKCPWCSRIFKNKAATTAHVYRAVRDKACQEAKIKNKLVNMRGKKVKTDDYFFCMYCQIEFDDLEKYHEHVRKH